MSNTIRRRLNLVYRIAAALDSECEIRRDPLHLQFSVNRGVTITTQNQEMRAALIEALTRKGLNTSEKVTAGSDMKVSSQKKCGKVFCFEVYPFANRI